MHLAYLGPDDADTPEHVRLQLAELETLHDIEDWPDGFESFDGVLLYHESPVLGLPNYDLAAGGLALPDTTDPDAAEPDALNPRFTPDPDVIARVAKGAPSTHPDFSDSPWGIAVPTAPTRNRRLIVNGEDVEPDDWVNALAEGADTDPDDTSISIEQERPSEALQAPEAIEVPPTPAEPVATLPEAHADALTEAITAFHAVTKEDFDVWMRVNLLVVNLAQATHA